MWICGLRNASTSFEAMEDYRPGIVPGGTQSQLSEDEQAKFNMTLDFSVADHFATRVDACWQEHKQQGNDLLKAGDLDGAVNCYTEGFNVADGSACSKRLVSAFSVESSPIRENKDITHRILSFLELPPVAPEPNLPAATCLSNRAACLLQQGKHEEALADAQLAVKLCPEYVKAHQRVRRAYEALGNKKEARRSQKSLADYKKMAVRWYAHAMLALRWIDCDTMEQVYSSQRSLEALRRISAKRPDCFEDKPMLVCGTVALQTLEQPSGWSSKRQWLKVALTHMDMGGPTGCGMSNMTTDCVFFTSVIMDEEQPTEGLIVDGAFLPKVGQPESLAKWRTERITQRHLERIPMALSECIATMKRFNIHLASLNFEPEGGYHG
jgi:tetratricopeptide (TPR) repeat protein